jgi:hypothetical protein
MANRTYVGQLPGGRGRIPDPSLPFHFDVGIHAPGRLNAERQKLLHITCLKAWGKLGNNPTLTGSGAVYQDFTGSPRYQRCHRSLFEPIVNGSPVPDLLGVASNPEFRTILISPGALTDPEPPPGNYGDRLLEIVSARSILDLIRSTVSRQPANRPLEINMLEDALAGELPIRFQKAYDDAISKAGDILERRGWTEVSITSKAPLEEAAQKWHETGLRGRSDSRAAKAIEELMQDLRSSGPQSELVNVRMDELQLAFYEAGGPSRYGRLAVDYLLLCQDSTKSSSSSLVNVEEAAAQIEATAEHGQSQKASADVEVALKGKSVGEPA